MTGVGGRKNSGLRENDVSKKISYNFTVRTIETLNSTFQKQLSCYKTYRGGEGTGTVLTGSLNLKLERGGRLGVGCVEGRSGIISQ